MVVEVVCPGADPERPGVVVEVVCPGAVPERPGVVVEVTTADVDPVLSEFTVVVEETVVVPDRPVAVLGEVAEAGREPCAPPG